MRRFYPRVCRRKFWIHAVTFNSANMRKETTCLRAARRGTRGQRNHAPPTPAHCTRSPE